MNYCIFCMTEIEQNAEVCPNCGKRQNTEIPLHHLVPGSILHGKFLIGAALGEGGFGITYIGRDLQLDMKVAIKEYFPSGYANRSNTAAQTVSIATFGERKDFFEIGRDRFLSEARTLARFSSEEGIVTVRDFFEENNTAYIVMEFLEGETLKSYLKEHGTLTPEQTVEMLTPVMKSLCKVHGQKLIHRDIAPDNIMLTNDGKVKLLDFGAARTVSSEANRSLSVMLKHGYAPEEQYRPRGEQGPWTDVYALAATMYKCITGVTPDDATERYHSDELKTPSALGFKISPTIESAIMKGLAVLKDDRYQNIEEFMKGLKEGSGTPVVGTVASVQQGQKVSEDHKGTMYVAPNSESAVKASTQPAQQSAPQKGKSKKGLIIGIASGAAVLLAAILLIVLIPKKNKPADKAAATDNVVINQPTNYVAPTTNPATTTKPGTTATNTTTTTATPKATTAPTATPAPTAPPTSSGEFNKSAAVTNSVSYDDSLVSISVDKIEYGNTYATVTLTIENKSDLSLRFSSSYFNSVNGYMLDFLYFSDTVTSGKKVKSKGSIYYKDLQTYGIDEIADVDIIFKVENSDDWNDYYYTDPITFETSAKAGHDYTESYFDKEMANKAFEKYQKNSKIINYSESMVISKNNITLKSATIVQNGDDIYLMFQISNNTDNIIYVQYDDISFDSMTASNGELSSYYIFPHKTYLDDIRITNTNICSKEMMELFKITSFKEIGFILTATALDNTQIFKEPVSIKIPNASSPDLSGVVVYNDNGITVTYKGLISAGSGSSTVYDVFIVKSSRTDTIQLREVSGKSSINGFMESLGLYSLTVDPGETCIWKGWLYSSSLKDIGINDALTEIKRFEFDLRLQDLDYNVIDQKTISVNDK